MPSGNREVIAATIFVPNVEGVVTAYKRNLSGTVGENPTRIGIGHYACLVPEDLDQLHSSITHHATNPSGQTRDVSVVISRDTPVVATTRLDIYIRAAAEEFGTYEDHLDSDTTIVAGGGSAVILTKTIVVSEGTKFDVEFTFAGEAATIASTLVAQLLVDGAPLDILGNGTGETSQASDDLVSGSIRRTIVLAAGSHTIAVSADAIGGNFTILASSAPTNNSGTLTILLSGLGGILTDDASFVEVTLSRLPE